MKNLKDDIKKLDLDSNIIEILNNNDVYIIEDLWILNRNDLKKYGLKDNEINYIVIKLELIGIDLNKKIYNCDIKKIRNSNL